MTCPVFVFGSNLAGRHGKGAAKEAFLNWGAEYGNPVGRQGNSYAIPTKDENLKTLPVHEIAPYVNQFIDYAKNSENSLFILTPIGCGLAGYDPLDIAPLFWYKTSHNIYYPREFIYVYEHLSRKD